VTLHVLVVDDSAVVRQMASTMLGAQGMDVSIASDPLIAMQKMVVRRPDVILLDIEMPRMDGLTFLRKVMREDPLPVVICSALAGPSSDIAFRALECGAVDVVAKPQVGLRDFLQESAVVLGDVIRGAAHARLRPALPFPSTHRRATRATFMPARNAVDADRIIALGASTGGTEALRHILTQFPRNAPGTVVVQHMPEVFTSHFAKRLDRDAAITVREAEDGDRIVNGLALIAPGDRHMSVERDAKGFYVTLADGALVSRHRPSVDVLFRSVAAAAGEHARGALLTGMGTDGADGLLTMRHAGAMTLAQDEATSIVFGMPREAILRGAAEHVLPLDEIAHTLVARGL
jgi:two-component system, chemotaxis family, protein-glutamate methylesterase/glutaminase